jgi:RNA polymerase sigma-70 factor, ECF subfamily
VDETDIRAFLAGDYGRLVAALSVVAGNRANAEEAVQEALARAWVRGTRGQRLDSPSVWIAVVARNLLRSGFRKILAERGAKARLQKTMTQAAIGEEREELLDVLAALASLPRRQREAVALHCIADLSLAETGRVIGTTEGAVKALMHRARGSLAEALRSREPRDPEEVNGVAGC